MNVIITLIISILFIIGIILLKPDTMHQRLKAIVQDQSKNNS